MRTRVSLPPLIGHRGAALHAPENSLEGFEQAAKLGARWVEFDVMLSADGVPVLHHDHDLQRTAGCPEAVAKLTARDLAQTDVGSHFGASYSGVRIPTLAAAIGCLSRLNLGANVEIKPAPGREVETTRAAVSQLQASWPNHLPPPLISSFSAKALATAAELAPNLPRGWLGEKLPEDWETIVSDLGCSTVHLGWEDLTEAAAREVKSKGYGLVVWTVNDPEVARRCRGWGADAIITDTPPGIAAALSGG